MFMATITSETKAAREALDAAEICPPVWQLVADPNDTAPDVFATSEVSVALPWGEKVTAQVWRVDPARELFIQVLTTRVMAALRERFPAAEWIREHTEARIERGIRGG